MSRNSELTPELRTKILADVHAGAKVGHIGGLSHHRLISLLNEFPDFARETVDAFKAVRRHVPHRVLDAATINADTKLFRGGRQQRITLSAAEREFVLNKIREGSSLHGLSVLTHPHNLSRLTLTKLAQLVDADQQFAEQITEAFQLSGRQPPLKLKKILKRVTPSPNDAAPGPGADETEQVASEPEKTPTSTPDPQEEAKPGTWRPDDSERLVPLPVENPSTPAGVWLPVDDPETPPEGVEPRQDSLEPGPANSDPGDTLGAAGTTKNPARESSASLNPPYRRRRQVLASQEPQSPQVPLQSRTSLTTAFQRRRWSHH
jgi:hypothetical protein